MTIALRTRPRALVLAFVFVLVTAAAAVLAASPATAQQAVGAAATKDCPNAPADDPYTIGDTVTCTFSFENIGVNPADVVSMTETSPVPGGTAEPITCTVGGTPIAVGDTLNPGEVCAGTFQATIPNDPALCNTIIVDRVDIEILDTIQDLDAGAFATHVLGVVCGPPPTTAPPTTPPTTAPPATPPANPPGELPRTGSETGPLLLLASLALAVGAGLLATVRRRRAHE